MIRGLKLKDLLCSAHWMMWGTVFERREGSYVPDPNQANVPLRLRIIKQGKVWTLPGNRWLDIFRLSKE